jgi:Bacterial Ig-like domain (group 3)/MBG domain (YGX type)/Domain of unknown function (DUF4214)/Right handed beta helix region
MSMPVWIRQVFARPGIRPIRKAPRRGRLAVEVLEDRWVPSTFVVNNPTDTAIAGQTDLRQAIASANATSTNDTITFDATAFATSQTITLGGSLLDLTKTNGTIAITGTTVGVTVSGGGASRVFQVEAKVTASVSGLTIAGGNATATANGGGVYNKGTLSLTNCTVSGNYGHVGGGFYNKGTLSLTNCTVSGNTAFIGAGVYNTYGSPAKLINCTISGNSASLTFGGFSGSAAATVGNTIIAGNTAVSGSPDVAGHPTSLGNNLIGITPHLAWVSSDITGTVAAPIIALLAPLANYGGPTQTMPLLPGSPAIGVGSVALVPAGISTDQRGQPRLLSGKVDIGAFESQGFTLGADAGSTPQSAVIGTTFANPLSVTVTAKNPIEPVNGGVVSFVAIPASNGAAAIFSSSKAAVASGHASITAAPDNVDGAYSVNAAVFGASASFALTNTGTPFAGLIVNTTTDALAPGVGILSLREAVGFANFDITGNANVTFNSGVFTGGQKITLTLGSLELNNASETETITGPTTGLTLDGGGTSGVFQIDAGATAAISGLTITHGSSVNGGGVSNDGTLTLTNCTISGNFAAQSGGGLYDGANAAVTLTNCTISGNSATQNGGGVYDGAHATATMTNSTISGNSTVNYGGGLYVGAYGAATLTNCTVSGNTSKEGGGINNALGATVTLSSSTIGGNASGFGGGVLNFGTLTLSQSTVASNSASYAGGGVYSVTGTTTTLGNTIVAGNTSSGATDLIGTVTSLGNNLIGNASDSSGWVSSDLTGTSAIPIAALLAPLGNFGGTTQTMPLLPGSPAIAAGNVALIPAGITTDQRGQPRLLNGKVDIGAFESQGFTLTVIPGSTPQSADVGTNFANPLGVTVTANNAVDPVDGGVVSFVAHPAATGASAVLSAPSATIASGRTSVTAAPNAVTGTYVVNAVDLGASAAFNLTNTGTSFTNLIVNTTVDSLAPGAGLLSLREAVGFANADSTGNAKITFDTAVFGSAKTITLTLGQLEWNNPNETETITGPAQGVTIDGGASSRVFQVDAGVTVSITGLTIAHGKSNVGAGLLNLGTLTLTACTVSGSTASTDGGGIMNSGTLTLDHSTVTKNSATKLGGGLYNLSSLTLTNSTISNNTASGNGGGVYNGTSATASLSGTTVSGNSGVRGGGVYGGSGSTSTLTDCTVSGNSATSGGGLFFYYSAMATLTGGTISGNTASNDGGGIGNGGTLAINGSTIENNNGPHGAGLYNAYDGSATLTNSAVTGNTSSGANGSGGGVMSHGNLMMVGSSATGNTAALGGGIYNTSGTATLTNCTISGNFSNKGGAGLYNGSNGTATLTGSTISGNTIIAGGVVSGGGGIYNSGNSTLTLTNCTISGNSSLTIGGGVLNANYGVAVLTNTTLSGNTATTNGGGLYNGHHASATLTNCTISGNTANSDGGGMYNATGGSATLINCTISGNSSANNGGGVYSANGTTNIGNSIVALNTAKTSGSDAVGTVVSNGNNLVGVTDGSSGWVSSDLTGTSAAPLNPLLAPRANYAGPTQTIALLPGSPAIDAGNNALIPSGVTTDQRGLPRTVNTTVDIGAFESSGFTIAVTSGSGQTTVASTAFSNPLVVTVTAKNAAEPVKGGVVTFTPPASGASATLTGIPATIDASGKASVGATANAVGGAYSVSATASGITTPASFDLANTSMTTFSGLTSPTIVYGTATTEFTGQIGSGGAFPTGSSVSVTLDSVTMTGVVDAGGNFSVTFTTASLGVAGSPYTVSYVFAGNSNFSPASDSTTKLTVTKANASVVVTPYSVNYDGTGHTATITSITGVNGEAGAAVGNVTLDSTHTNAGTYASDSWSFAGSANYNDIASTTITDAIAKANAMVVVTPYNISYDGTAHTATITSITGANGETGATVGSVALDTTHTNAGTYASDSWSFAGTANYNDIASTTITDIISKANATVVIAPYNVMYDGSAHSATITSITGVNGETGATVGDVTLDSTHTNAGTYASDSWSFAGTANYNDIASTTITDTIGKANATVVVTPYSVPYDGSAHTATITSITGVNGETGATVGSVTLNTTHTNAGTYASDSWSFAGAANYNDIASTAITDTIAKVDATVVVTPYSVMYDGTAHTATVTSITGVNGETGAAVGAVTLNSTHTSAGTYASDSWSFTGAGNYNDIASTTITDEISLATLTITANNASKVYGTLATFSGAAFTESGLVTGDSITGVTETSTGAPTSAVVASYDIVPSAATGTGLGNYTIVYVNGTLTVNPAGTVTTVASSANPSGVGTTVTFTATITPNSGAFDNGGTVQFVIDGANFGAPVTPVAGQASIADSTLGQGNHTVSATYSGDSNLIGSSGTLAGGQTVQVTSGQINGTVFRDFNLNGHQDAGEPGVAGQTVFLDLTGSGVIATGDPTATTAADGSYTITFSGLQPGAYNLHQVLFGGVLLSTPAGGSYTVMAGSQLSFPNLNFGEVPTSITVPLTLPPTTPFPGQGNANADYVEGIYRAFLNRNADPGGLAFWTGVLNSGSQTRLQVVLGIRNSPEHYTQEVDAFYRTLLLRSADPQGEAFWVGKLQAGLPEEQIAASFLNSPEYLSKGDKFFVDSMYNSLLGRQADPAGEAFWLSQLGDDAAGNPVKPPSLTHAQVIADFIYSTESFDRLVEGTYSVLLQRQTDVDGLNSWINALEQGEPFATISEQFAASNEFFNNAAAHG